MLELLASLCALPREKLVNGCWNLRGYGSPFKLPQMLQRVLCGCSQVHSYLFCQPLLGV